MSRIDLNTNRNSLSSAHSEICDPHSPNNWVIFGYDGKTNVLKVVEKGDGGIEELVDEVNSGRIQYIWIRVQDPNTALPKFVLVNWQGEGVQEIRKGNCVNHFRDVENFFRGAHVTIQARSEDDLDESEIMDKVAKSSGSNYSFHKEKARPIEEPKPVGSVYQKTRPTININVRDQFWEKTQEEEQRRVEEEKQNRQAIAQKMERERKEREAAEQAERDRKESERMKKIIEIKHAEKRANSENKEKIKEQWEQQQSDAIREEQERKKRSEQMRKQRSAEAAALVGKRAMNPKSVFQQNNESQFDKPTTAPSRKLKSTFLEHDDSTPATRKQPIQLPTVDPGNAAELENTPAESENSMTSGKPRRPQPSKLAANRFLSRDEDEQPSYTRKQPIQLPTEDPGNAAELESEPTQSEADYEEQEQPYRPPARPGKLPPNRVAVMPTTQQPMVDEEEERRLAEERQMEEQRRQEEAMREEQMRQEQIRQQQEAARTSMGGAGDGASLMKQGLPRRQADSDEEPADDDAWGDDDEPSLPQAVIASPLADDTQVLYDDATHVTHDDPQALYDDATHVAKDDQQELYDDATHVARDDQQALYDDATHVARDDQQMLYDDVNTSAKSNLRAKALYDYQAADDTEITFDPDDIITNVEQIDDGWWTGTAPNGDHGMFPANYVELI